MDPAPARLLAAALLAAGCARSPDLVVYCALDQEHGEPLIRRFEAETGLAVRAEFDVEASKTVGLVRRLRAAHRRPNTTRATVAAQASALSTNSASPPSRTRVGLPPPSWRCTRSM